MPGVEHARRRVGSCRLTGNKCNSYFLYFFYRRRVLSWSLISLHILPLGLFETHKFHMNFLVARVHLGACKLVWVAEIAHLTRFKLQTLADH